MPTKHSETLATDSPRVYHFHSMCDGVERPHTSTVSSGCAGSVAACRTCTTYHEHSLSPDVPEVVPPSRRAATSNGHNASRQPRFSTRANVPAMSFIMQHTNHHQARAAFRQHFQTTRQVFRRVGIMGDIKDNARRLTHDLNDVPAR